MKSGLDAMPLFLLHRPSQVKQVWTRLDKYGEVSSKKLGQPLIS